MIKIRPYKSTDYKKIVKFEEELQDYLVQMDPLKLIRRTKEFSTVFINDIFDQIKKFSGRIYIAEIPDKKQIIGFIAGIIRKSSKLDMVQNIPLMRGRVIELYVEPEYRGKKVAAKLMNEMEKYFKNKKCTIMKVEVFKPNTRAHRFYEKCGFQERVIDMIKEI